MSATTWSDAAVAEIDDVDHQGDHGVEWITIPP